jgi:hypothetical protein
MVAELPAIESDSCRDALQSSARIPKQDEVQGERGHKVSYLGRKGTYSQAYLVLLGRIVFHDLFCISLGKPRNDKKHER